MSTYTMDEDALSSSSKPETRLLVALLDRCWRDLDSKIETALRRSAVAWFLSKKEPSNKDKHIKFSYVIEHLCLTEEQVKHLIDTATKVDRDIEVVDIKTPRVRTIGIARRFPPDITA